MAPCEIQVEMVARSELPIFKLIWPAGQVPSFPLLVSSAVRKLSAGWPGTTYMPAGQSVEVTLTMSA